MKLIFDDIISTIGIKYIKPTEEFLTLPPGMYEVVDINETLKDFFSSNTLVDSTVDDIKVRTNSTIETKRNDLKFDGK